MATISIKHEYVPEVELKPINPVYETRPYVSGNFFLGFGGIATHYKKEMVSYDGLEEVWTCAKCGQLFEHEYHQLIVHTNKAS